MKRISCIFLALTMLLALSLLCACANHSASSGSPSPEGENPSISSGETSDIPDAPSADGMSSGVPDEVSDTSALPDTDVLPDVAIPDADRVYLPFLLELRSQENAPSRFVFKDLDGDGVDELLTKGGEAITLTVYSFRDTVKEIGSYDIITGIGRLFDSGDSAYPGIVFFSVGGGRDWYHYISIKEGSLSVEVLWTDNYGHAEEGTPERVTKHTDDERLIELSREAYEKNRDIQFYPIAAVMEDNAAVGRENP